MMRVSLRGNTSKQLICTVLSDPRLYKCICLCVCEDLFIGENMQSRNEAFVVGTHLRATQIPSSMENGLNMTCVFKLMYLNR